MKIELLTSSISLLVGPQKWTMHMDSEIEQCLGQAK